MMALKAIIIACSIALCVNCVKLPGYIKRCKLNDENHLECAKAAAQEALNFIVKGDEEYNLPSLTPYELPLVELTSGENLKMKFDNCTLTGFENIKFTRVEFDPTKKHVSFDGNLDKINMLANYEINGRILVLPIVGSGAANITFVGIQYSYNLHYDLVDKKSEEFMKIVDSKLTFSPDRAYYKLENLFNGNEVLSEQMNKILDENWKEVGAELNPALSEIVNSIITRVTKNIVTKVPFKDLFLES